MFQAQFFFHLGVILVHLFIPSLLPVTNAITVLQVCKNRPIFKIICSHKCCLIQEYHAFLVKNLMKTDVSILNLTTHGALINFKSFYRLVKPGLQNGYSIGYWFSFGWSSILSFPHRLASMTGARQSSGLKC